MTKIKNTNAYPFDVTISDLDYVIGSDGDNLGKITRNYNIGDLRRYINSGLSPEVGGTLKVSEITYNGVLTSPSEVANALDPNYQVLQYHIVIFSVNGNKYILKEQDITLGLSGTAITDEDFILIIGFTKLGDGTNVLKGYNTTTKLHEFYSVKSTGNTISVVSNNIVIDPKEGTSLGEGQPIYKGLNVTTKLHEFYSVKSTGNTISVVSNNIVIDPKEGTSLGEGQPIYKGLNVTTKLHEFYNLKSNTLNIELTDGDVFIDTPETASIPALYVNNLYIPSYPEWLAENKIQNGGTAVIGFVFRGKGTLAQPFTDSVVYPLAGGSPTITPNTVIQNALDGDSTYDIPYSYVGSTALSYSRLNPQRQGQRIIVQNNNSFYTHAGDYNYNYIRIHFQCSVLNTTSNYIIDMDNPAYFNATTSMFEITIDEGLVFQCDNSLGFRNSGNTSSTTPAFDTGRTGFFLGEGEVYFNYSGVDILTRYIFNSEGNINDGNLHFQVKCKVRADQQGIYLCKNREGIDIYNQLTSGTLNGTGNIALQAFRMTGGQIRFFDKGGIYLANHTSGRTYGITFEPEDDGIGNCTFQLNSAKVAGTSENCFTKLNDEHVDFLAFNSPSGDSFSTTLTGTPTLTNGLFENLGATPWQISFKNNVFSFTGIDQTKVDLTQGNSVSTINFIGGSVLESLVIYNNRAAALLAGRPLNSVFLISKTITAGSFIVGKEYKIVSVGTTNFTLIGASANTVGLWFVATGVGTGDGTAKYDERTILT